jgi:DNA polymerase epsilon subunit 2
MKFPKLAKEGCFVLIPSMNDVGMGNILPRPPLPRYFLKGLQSKVKHVHLASNPCRLRYFSKEIVLSRIDVLSKLRKNCIMPPRDSVGIHHDNDKSDEIMLEHTNTNNMDRLIQHSIKTVLDQGHLCPVPLQTTPIYWQYDHALRLYPSPDVLVLSESTTKRYSEKYENDVEVMNPGPFNVDYKFLVMKPCDAVDDGDELFVNVEFSEVAQTS